MDISVSLARSSLLGKVSLLVAVYMAVAAAGACGGSAITSGWSLLWLFLGGIGCLIGMNVLAETLTAAALVLAIAFAYIIGLLMSNFLATEIATNGWETLAGAFIGASASMLLFGAYGYLSNRDLRSWYPGLLFGLFGLTGFGFALCFFGGGFLTPVYGLAGVVLFAGFFIYDLNQLRRTENTWGSAVLSSINVFLDFANIFQDYLLFLK